MMIVGGEIFTYHLVHKTWKRLRESVGYSFVGLDFDRESQKIYASRFSSQKISHIVVLNEQGKTLRKVALEKPLDFAKNKWRLRVQGQAQRVNLLVMNPAQPQGNFYSVLIGQAQRAGEESL